MPLDHLSWMTHRKGFQVGEVIKWIVLLIPALILVAVVLTMVVGIGTKGVPFSKTLLAIIKCNFGV